MTRRYNKPDVGYAEKLTVDLGLVFHDQKCQVDIHWHRTYKTEQNAGAAVIYPAGSVAFSKQFEQLATPFTEYKVTGFKIEYKAPVFVGGNQTDRVYEPMLVGTAMNLDGALPWPMPLQYFKGSLDSKQFTPLRDFKRYYKTGWFLESVNEPKWRKTYDALQNAYNLDYNDCVTSILCSGQGIQDGTIGGTVRVTYYIKFRARQ